MPEFDLATGVVRFKGDLDQFEADIIKAQKKADKLNEALGSNAGKQRFSMALTTARSLNAEMEKYARIAKTLTPKQMANDNKQQRDTAWLSRQETREQKQKERQQLQSSRMIAANEKTTAREEKKHLDEVMKKNEKIKEQRREMGRAAVTLGAAGAAAGASAIAAGSTASPLAADTLEKSFKLFTVTVGQTFVPLVMDMSFALQDAAKWWKSLDGGIKENIASMTKMVAIAGAATLGMSALGTALTFISKNPLVVGAGLVAGAVSDTLNPDRTPIGQSDSSIRKMLLDSGAVRKLGEGEKPGIGEVLATEFGKQGGKKRGDLGIAGPASFTQASELLRSIQQAAMGTSELDAKIKAAQVQNDMKVLLEQIRDNTKTGKVVG